MTIPASAAPVPAAPVPAAPTDEARRARAAALAARADASRSIAWLDCSDRRESEELALAEALAPLAPQGYWVLHDRHWPSGLMVDHVIIGPKGVFVIHTTTWTGAVDVREGSLRAGGRRRDSQLQTAIDGARDLAHASFLPVDAVRPVLCFTRAEAAITGTLNGVDLTQPGNIVDWILMMPDRFDELQGARVAARVQQVLPQRLAHAPAVAPPSLEFPAFGSPAAEEDESPRRFRFLRSRSRAA